MSNTIADHDLLFTVVLMMLEDQAIICIKLKNTIDCTANDTLKSAQTRNFCVLLFRFIFFSFEKMLENCVQFIENLAYTSTGEKIYPPK